MKKLRLAGLFLCALLIAAPAAAQQAAKEKPPQPGVLARVGSETITEQEVQEVLDQMSPTGRTPEAKRRIVENIVELYVFANEAKNVGLLDDPEVQKRLKEMTTVVLARSFFDRYVAGKAEVPDEAVRKEYEKNKKNFEAPAQVHAMHILVKDKGKAEELLARLKKGESFEELAKKESQDPMSARRGGDLGWQSCASLDSKFAKAAAALKKGELSPIVQTGFGYHIIKLIDRKDKRLLTFEEVKEQLRASLERQEIDRLKESYLKKADVEVFMPESQAPGDEEVEPEEGD